MLRDLTEAMAHIIATNIKALRMARQQNQTEFAEALGVSQGTVARWEAGSTPKNDALLRLSEMANVTPREFSAALISNMKDVPRDYNHSESSSSIMLPVLLPSEEALFAMFRSLLSVVEDEKDLTVAARRLAQLLPDALARTVFRSTAQQPDLDGASVPEEGAATRTEASRAPLR